MAQYVMVYIGCNHPSTPEEGKQHFAKHMQWIESLGDAAVSPANPLMHTATVRPDGSIDAGSAVAMSGYTIVEAESIDAAVSMAQACPFLEIGGSMEVSELGLMSGI